MKLAGAKAAEFCAAPDPAIIGALLHGPDAGLLGLRRRQLVDLLTEGDDLRLTRLDPAMAQKDPAEIDAGLRTRGFFPGRRVVLIDGARDGLTAGLKKVLTGLGPEAAADAFLVVIAANLTARSSLRKLFEGAPTLMSLGLYPDAPGMAELASMLDAAGLSAGLTPDAMEALVAVAADLDRGSLLQLVDKIALYGMGGTEPMALDVLLPLMPAAADSDLDRLVEAVANGQAEAIGPLIGRLSAAGTGAAGMMIACGRHFGQLLRLAAARDGIEAALGRLQPPAFGLRRQALANQARRWGPARLENANRLLFQTDGKLRSAGDRPDRAMVERCLIRLAMMVGRS